MKLLSKLLNRWFEKRLPGPMGTPGKGMADHRYDSDIYDFDWREQNRHYLEFLLIRYWSKNKNAEGIFEFEPVNVHKNTTPFFIDAIKYDTSTRSEGSLIALASTASDDKLMFRPHCKEPMPFIDAPSFRTQELTQLVIRLNQTVGPSLWYTTEQKEK